IDMKKNQISAMLILAILVLLTACSQEVEEASDIPETFNDNITVYTSKDGLIDDFISSLRVEHFKDRDIIWIGTWKGLVKFDDERWVVYTEEDGLAQNHITDISIDSEHHLWVSSISLKKLGGLSFYNGHNWKSHRKLGDENEPGNIITIHVDSKKRVWTGSWGNGINMFDGDNWVNFNKEKSGIPSDEILDIAEYNGHIWFATKYSGAFYLDESESENTWVSVNEHSSNIINNSICSLASTDDRLWIGTWGGVSLFEKGNWTNYTSWGEKLADNFVRVIDIDVAKDAVYFGTDKGLSIFEEGKWDTVTIDDGLPSNKILSIANTQRHVWIGTDKGLVRMLK
ncbi:MAG: hypothetical protein ACOCWO_03360, partial [Candidatus Muiribacteriaceae bacterium]